MLVFFLVFSILFGCVNFVLVVYLFNELKILKTNHLDHAVILAKVVYHVSKDIEDFETTEKIHDKLSGEINLYKFL
jgi:ABC-type transport system involved in multi-copper enzyme maturation permease subunit